MQLDSLGNWPCEVEAAATDCKAQVVTTVADLGHSYVTPYMLLGK
jgi:hypothetical protein